MSFWKASLFDHDGECDDWFDFVFQAKVAPRGGLVMALGLACLLAVPVFRTVTGLPPYMGMLAGLGFLWLFVDAIHFGEDKK